MIDSAIMMKLGESNVSKQYILNSENQPYAITNEMTSKGLESINIYDKKNLKTLKKGINVWKVISKLNKNKMEVTIIDFHLTFSKNNYHFANGGGSTIIFEYSCENETWKLLSAKHSGI